MRRLITLAALSLGLAAAQAAPAGVLALRYLDVGQGDAVLITAPTGQTMLVDGGRSAPRLQTLLKQYGVSRIDAVVASHWDSDHIMGLVPAVQLFKPKVFINNGVASTTQVAGRLTSAAKAAGSQGLAAQGQDRVINLGDVKVTVMAPPAGVKAGEQNVNSVGILVQYGQFRALMTGDSETEETTGWLRKYTAAQLGPIDVYKSIHHGAANGDNAAWLAAVRPRNVVISVGPNNYGHPTASALALYKKMVPGEVWRTDQQGTITVTVQPQGKSYAMAAEKGGNTVSYSPLTPAKPASVPTRPTPPQAPKPAPAKPIPATPAPAGVTYRNCTEARAAGVTPLRAGHPGYSHKLDRDGDGIACE